MVQICVYSSCLDLKSSCHSDPHNPERLISRQGYKNPKFGPFLGQNNLFQLFSHHILCPLDLARFWQCQDFESSCFCKTSQICPVVLILTWKNSFQKFKRSIMLNIISTPCNAIHISATLSRCGGAANGDGVAESGGSTCGCLGGWGGGSTW